MCPAVDLNGAWSADDGGTYFIRQLGDGSVTWAGLQNSGFHRGVGFTNVFHGQISPDSSTLTGQWADVPRGRTLNAGTLSLQLVSAGNPDILVPVKLTKNAAGSTGGFGATTWTPGAASLGPQDIEDVDGRVQRYDVPLGENNPPCRDFSVMWGVVGKVTRSALPPNPNDYCSFVGGDWDGDGDVNFDLSPDFSRVEPDFWTEGWLARTFARGQTALAANEYILSLFDQFKGIFHCEAAMYGREQDSSHCSDPPTILLPGWNESEGNSVLINGWPIAGNIVNVTDHRVTPPALILQFTFGPATDTVRLARGTEVRVTGVVADDAGHEGETAPEIHPVYAIDIPWLSPTRTRPHPIPLPIPSPVTLTGAWHSDDVGTYYVRQIGSTVWWLGMSHDQGRSFANVFRGVLSGGHIEGSWVDVPMGVAGVLGGGALSISCADALATKMIKTSTADVFGGTNWIKLYDVETPPRPPEPIP